MTHKTLVKIALIMVVVFGATILLYPLLFNPDSKGKAAIEAPPVSESAPNSK